MKRILTTFLFTLVAFMLLPSSTLAFGITPAELFVEDIRPGGHYEADVYVSRSPDEVNQELTVELDTSQLGEMESWFNFIPGKQFSFPLGENVTTFRVTVDIPAGADIGNFDGRITATGVSPNKASEGVTIAKGAILGVDITTTESEVAKLKVLSVSAPEVNSGDPVRLLLNIENQGNVATSPDEVRVEVMDLFENPKENLTTTDLEEIPPYTTKEIKAAFNSDLEKGQYRIDASVIFDGEEIFSKKMVLTVNARPASIDEETRMDSEAEQKAQAEAEGTVRSMGLALIILGGSLLLAVLLLVFKKSALSSAPKSVVRFTKIMKENNVLKLALSVAALISIAVGVYLYLVPASEMYQGDEVMVGEESKDTGVESATEPAEMEMQEEVRGLSTESEREVAESDGSILEVERPGTPGLYQVFSEPNFSSEIVYEAEAGENFDVVHQEGEWYNVVLSDGSEGWLHESSIQSR